MKFWFCEKCGKRITETDFPVGLDPEKSDGDVICKACAVPIPVMPAHAPGHGVSKTKILRPSGPSHAQAHSAPSGTAKGAPAPPTASKTNLILLAVAVAIILLVVGLMLNLNSGTKAPPKAAAAPAAHENGADHAPRTPAGKAPVSAEQPANHRPETSREISAPAPLLARDNAEQAASDAFDALRGKLSGLDAAAQAAALQDFIDKFPNSIISARARRMLNAVAATPADTAEKLPTKPVAKPRELAKAPSPRPEARDVEKQTAPAIDSTAAAKPDEAHIDPALAAYMSFQADFVSALNARQSDRAAALLDAAQKNALLSSRQAQLAPLHCALDWLKELDGALAKGAALLKDVDDFALPMAHGEPLRIGRNAAFKLTEFKDGVLNLSNQGLTLPVPLASLTDEGRAKLIGRGLGDGAHARLVRSFADLIAASDKQLAAAASDARAVLQRVQKAKPAAPATELACLQEVSVEFESACRERTAASAWKQMLNGRTLKTLDPADLVNLRDAMKNFIAAHGTTFFAAQNESEIKAWETALNSTLMNGLLAWWSLDETSGDTATDDSAHKLTATLIGAPHAVPGKHGNAIALNGSNQYIVAPDKLIFGKAELSISVWFKTRAGGVIYGYQDAPPLQNPANFVPCLYVDVQGKVRGQFWRDGLAGFHSTAAVNDGAWHHALICTKDNTQWLYLDGQNVGSLKGRIQYLQMIHSQFGIGYGTSWPGSKSGYWPFQGELDEIRVYDRLLTPAEIQQLAEAPGQ